MSDQSIFLNALERAAAEREEYLVQACAGNEPLRREIEGLLAAHERGGTFLDAPAIEQIARQVPAHAQNTISVAQNPDHGPNDSTAIGEQSAASSDETLAFLQPPTRPGSIGRLAHYEILEKIGSGGFGTVLKAFDDRLHRVVAIKVMAFQLATSGTARKRFIREARSAAAVRNDHVVSIHAIEEGNLPYLVMEFVAGQTLQQKLDSSGPPDVKAILRIAQQIAVGLSAAHATGLIHRDIKPANVLLENGVERVKITDFGLARTADDASISQSGVVAGTPTYMAPEQARGEHIDHRADLFSLGSVMYAMCTGHPPFRASTTMAVLKRVVEEVPRPIREINPEIPQWLCEVVEKLHAKKPEDRYQSAMELADVLTKYLTQIQMHGQVTSQPMPVVAIPVASAPEASPAGSRGTDATLPCNGRRSKILVRWGTIALGVSGIVAFLIWHLYPWPATLEIGGGSHFYDYTIVVEGENYPTKTLLLDKDSKGGAGHKLELPAGTYRVNALMNDVLLHSTEVTVKAGQHHAVNVPVVGGVLEIDNTAEERLRIESKMTSFLVEKNKSFTLPVGFYCWRLLTESGKTMKQGEFFLPPGAGGRYTLRIPSPSDDGWVQLFNSKDLTGWKPGENADEVWQAKDGRLMGSDGPGYLFSTKSYENFHLRAVVQMNPKGNSGISFRNKFQMEIRDDPLCPIGSLLEVGPTKTRTLVRHPPTSIRANVWYTLEIRAQGASISVRVNEGPWHEARDERPEGARTGLLELEAGKDTLIVFRKIEIREMPATSGSRLVKLQSFTPGKDPLPLPHRGPASAVTVVGDAWRIENTTNAGNFNVMVAQALEGIPKDGVLVFRAKVKVEAKHKDAWGELGFGAANQVFKSWDQWPSVRSRYVGNDSEWTEKEVHYPAAEVHKKDPPTLYLYAGLHTNGVLLLKDVELLHLPAAKDSSATQSDLDRLQGAWQAVTVERTGKALTPEEVKAIRFEFTGNKMKSSHVQKDVAQGAVFTLNPTTDPKHITVKLAPDSTFSVEGIYHFDGDRLIVCMPMFGAPKPRPTKFALDPADPARAMMTFVRDGAVPNGPPPFAIAPFNAAKAKEHQDAWAKHLSIEPEVSNAIGMKLRVIPPGEFTMGTSVKEIDWLLANVPDLRDNEDWLKDIVRNEGPDRRITVREPFLLGAHEVTVGEFREFVKATKYKTEAESNGGGKVWNNTLKDWEQNSEAVWSSPKYSRGESHPVVFITLADARAFCEWLSEKDGRKYTLPSEEQWEYACRAGTTTRWFFGDEANGMKDYGWTVPNSGGLHQPVGRKLANPFGLFDMHGNACELAISPQNQIIERGGKTSENPERARSAWRFPVKTATESHANGGFRVAIVGVLKQKNTENGPAPRELPAMK